MFVMSCNHVNHVSVTVFPMILDTETYSQYAMAQDNKLPKIHSKDYTTVGLTYIT